MLSMVYNARSERDAWARCGLIPCRSWHFMLETRVSSNVLVNHGFNSRQYLFDNLRSIMIKITKNNFVSTTNPQPDLPSNHCPYP
jgi:hypothetical protein